ncbi:MAG: hypothetical protein JNJ57_09440 [Saprospiraceae bacterium]|nr:hypothetical protein [Saprospiraceae bacterium]
MKTKTSLKRAGLLAAALLLLCCHFATARSNSDTSSIWINPFICITASDIDALNSCFEESTASLKTRHLEIKNQLLTVSPTDEKTVCGLLLERFRLDEELQTLETEHQLKSIKLRYRKGVEIVKMLYEKILSMDHHFSSLKVQQNLLKISNPHHYPEFKEARTAMEEKLKRKYNFALPTLFQSNPFLSAAFSMIGMVIGGGEEKDKKESMDRVACILDFTVRMYNDLNVIYYETGYLRDANLTLKKDCEALFSDCARQVGYTITLEGCRQSDDWERLYSLLDNLVAKALGETAASQGFPSQPDTKLLLKAETNLQFAIDRVVQFINRYSDFVNQGNEYYKKFAKIADSYENEKSCTNVLPDEFRQLKTDIDQTLEKFNSAYRMPEVQGSKLKDMLYGTID